MSIPYGRQSISEDDIEAVIAVMRSDYLTQGPVVPRFEELINRQCNSQFAVAVNSATSALHIACLALGVGRGDRVWTSAVTFVASANCARYCGANVDFVDIDDSTFNMSINHLKQKLEEADKTGMLPKVVIPVHLAGQSCDMESIHHLSKKYGFRILEDASHAIGATYKGRPVGSCAYSDISVFSFHPVKIITTCEGGAATTNDKELAVRMALLRSHGVTREIDKMHSKSNGDWHYEQIDLGFNYRMSDLHAALGASQIMRISEFIEKRHIIANQYDSLLANQPVATPWQHPDTHSSYHLYIVRPDSVALQVSRNDIFAHMRTLGILVNLHYMPVYRHPHHANFGYKRSDYPNSERYYCEAISLPIFPGLVAEQQSEVVSALLGRRGYQTIF